LNDEDTTEVKGEPVKGFFIDVITRDISVLDTISEFVDNSIDGAERVTDEKENYSDLSIEIEVDEKELEITDNCGGIPKDVAENYAFRFGRPSDVEDELDSIIGKFGVGMKRGFFKLGNKFLVESKTQDNHFIIETNVEEWARKESWSFDMEPVSEENEKCELTEVGTRLVVRDFNPEVKKKFKDPLFISQISKKLKEQNQNYIADGLSIIVNDEKLDKLSIRLLASDNLVPGYEEFPYEQNDKKVNIELMVGLAEPDPDSAGWYIFCNGRMILKADTTDVTGWDLNKESPIPKFHNKYARFRGYAFLNGDPELLPWNSSKTGVNPDLAVYQKTREKMINIMRPVKNFLDKIAKQKKNMDSDNIPPLKKKVNDSEFKNITSISWEERDFSGPKSGEIEESGPKKASIQYEKPEKKVEKAKKTLKATSNKEVGERSFDYFYEYEVE